MRGQSMHTGIWVYAVRRARREDACFDPASRLDCSVKVSLVKYLGY